VKHSHYSLDVVEGVLLTLVLISGLYILLWAPHTHAQTNTTPTLSEATKIKLLLAQHDLEQTQVRFAQLQQQFQQQQTQISAEAGKEFQALEALKETAYAEAKADKAAWTLTDKMEFVPVRRPNAPGIAGPASTTGDKSPAVTGNGNTVQVK
jgi:hypothetical protein